MMVTTTITAMTLFIKSDFDFRSRVSRTKVLSIRCECCVCCYRVSHEKRVKELSHQLTELTQQRDVTTQQNSELKVQMNIVEDCRDAVKRDLADAADNIRRGINRGRTSYNNYYHILQ